MNADNLCEATNYTGNDTYSMSVGSRGARWTILYDEILYQDEMGNLMIYNVNADESKLVLPITNPVSLLFIS
ncbi:hypothetical protein KQX54_008142 [Cotesia glomerata]|uniref:Bee-milk protein n=1 Tax=Cotesia glomerata TaxID=32391 RepID=A0AAV7ILT6_COTGL|nr:hypothetical protein KQX54_008142 [Cotesia glomerata]